MLHLTHIGIVRMKSLARMHVWWPNIEVDIAAHCKDCTACAETGPNQPDNLSTWPVPDGPWQRIHMYFAGPFLDDITVGRDGCVLEMATRSETKQVSDI